MIQQKPNLANTVKLFTSILRGDEAEIARLEKAELLSCLREGFKGPLAALKTLRPDSAVTINEIDQQIETLLDGV